MIRLGLCCIFQVEPIKFRTTTAAYLNRIENSYDHLESIVAANIESLQKALEYCAGHGIGSFRINSQFLPLCSHPKWKYELKDLPNGPHLLTALEQCYFYRKKTGIRLTLHPDQFIVLNSPKDDVVKNAIAELEYHATLSDLLGIDVINIHAGGVYGNKSEALSRFKKNYQSLSDHIKQRLTLENDDKSYTPQDLLPLCKTLGIPFVYDVHHHRCLKDGKSIEETTDLAFETWNREPLFHISSPLNGWENSKPHRHHDFISIDDFPKYWEHLQNITIEVEAKAKEIAITKLQKELEKKQITLWQTDS